MTEINKDCMYYTFFEDTMIGFKGITLDEAEDTFKMYKDKIYPNTLDHIYFTADGEFLNVEYRLKEKSFERLRRITGYLVGTVDRWNDGKRAELEDRVKHSTDIEELK